MAVGYTTSIAPLPEANIKAGGGGGVLASQKMMCNQEIEGAGQLPHYPVPVLSACFMPRGVYLTVPPV